jgi:hypothetical protein
LFTIVAPLAVTPQDQEEEEYTPSEELVDCARYGELEDVQRLLGPDAPHGVDINFADEYGNTAAHNGS